MENLWELYVLSYDTNAHECPYNFTLNIHTIGQSENSGQKRDIHVYENIKHPVRVGKIFYYKYFVVS